MGTPRTADHAAAGTDSVPLLDARDVKVTYGGFTAVHGATLTIQPGERVALVGESGSGKTTLAMAVAGLLPATSTGVTSSTLTFDGEPVTPSRGRISPVSSGLSVVFQDAMTSLDPVWRVESQLTAVLRGRLGLSRRQARPAALDWLRKVGFTDPERVMRARPYELSGGMRQRVMIAIAVCGRPRLLIADEPTSALDATLARATMELLVDLTEDAGAALLMVTHDLHLCLEYADKVCVMRHGDIVETLSAELAESTATHPYTRGLLACVPTLDSVDLHRLPTLAAVLAQEEDCPEVLEEVAS
ncbi:MAG: ABC transporter ATP-binding protein [Nocardioidaceae bacterium]